jgi:hypothetical protein
LVLQITGLGGGEEPRMLKGITGSDEFVAIVIGLALWALLWANEAEAGLPWVPLAAGAFAYVVLKARSSTP